MIFAVGFVFGQKNTINYPAYKGSFTARNLDTAAVYGMPLVKKENRYYNGYPLKEASVQSRCNAVPAPVISSNFYTQNFGFFCKKELQLEKITKIPFKFRLGSVQQVDRMEGKPNAAGSF